jgi:hypothetical protein
MESYGKIMKANMDLKKVKRPKNKSKALQGWFADDQKKSSLNIIMCIEFNFYKYT